jgi:ABC-type multidrug transport system fused ATPase/permease subunit
MPDINMASSVGGIMIVLMILFSGFIQPKSEISYGWEWFYWINPISWALRSVTINQFKAARYDFNQCLDVDCTTSMRYGDAILTRVGLPLSEKWVWYGFAVLLGEYLFLLLLCMIVLAFVKSESKPNPPFRYKEEEFHDDERFNTTKRSKTKKIEAATSTSTASAAPTAAATATAAGAGTGDVESQTLEQSGGAYPRVHPASDNAGLGFQEVSLQEAEDHSGEDITFEPLTLAFRDLYYTIQLNGQDLELIRGVSGYFQPGTLTALMGTTGAGKNAPHTLIRVPFSILLHDCIL